MTTAFTWREPGDRPVFGGGHPPGFRPATRSGVFVVADGRVTADFNLQMGESTQSVDVVAAPAEVLNMVSGEVAHVVDKEQVDNLALNGRAYMELLTLVPGAIITNPDQFGVLTSLSATNQSLNGHRSNQNNFTVDGVGNLDNGSNGSLINNVSPDFLQEVKIQTSNFSSEYGRSTGAAFNIVTKNGTNRFHGGSSSTSATTPWMRAISSRRTTPSCATTIGAGTSAVPSRRTSSSSSSARSGSKIRAADRRYPRDASQHALRSAGNFSGSKPHHRLSRHQDAVPEQHHPHVDDHRRRQGHRQCLQAVMPQCAILADTGNSNNCTFAESEPAGLP